jgi:ABC-type phosphate transport system permease subunit
MDLSLTGESLLAGILVLTFMILPFFVTVATDSLRAIPDSYRLGGLALGLNNWRAITRLTIPPAIPGLVAGLTLAAARAIGEAIAISMVAGALGHIPDVRHGFVFFLEPIRTLASAIVENGEGMDTPQVSASAFALATILLVFSLMLSLAARAAFGAFAKRMRLVSDRTA